MIKRMKRTTKNKLIKQPALKTLALDPATACGWALSNTLYGVWDLRIKKDESDGMRIVRFRSKFIEIVESEKVTLVVFERPAGRNVRGIMTQSELQSQIKTICIDRGIDYRAYSATEIKRFATGKGNAGKPAMIKAAQDKLGYTGDDDNEADALWLLNLAKSEYK